MSKLSNPADTGQIILSFRSPSEPLSANRRGQGWQKAYRLSRPWSDAVTYLARTWRETYRRQRGKPYAVRPVTVQATLPFETRRIRDGHNYTSTTGKAIVDGLVQAGIIPDDNPDWVTMLDPVIEAPSTTATVIVRERTDGPGPEQAASGLPASGQP
jgi:hypothetical protein